MCPRRGYARTSSSVTYAQPRWTRDAPHAVDPRVRHPEGKTEVGLWYRPTFDDGEREARMLAEFEVGLPHRFQLDLYARADKPGDGSRLLYGQQIEVRWAFADWGKIRAIRRSTSSG